MIGIFSNGLRTNRSGSPETIQFALPEMASSRYISSFGSRQTFTLCVTGTKVATDSYSFINSSFTSILTYLSNLGLVATLINSARAEVERRMISAFFWL